MYWLINFILITWMLLIIWQGQKLISQYPLGLSRKKAQNKNLYSICCLVLVLLLITWIYFSAWVANWPSQLAISNYFYSNQEIANLISTAVLLLSTRIISILFSQQKKLLSIYQQLYGLMDFLPANSLKMFISLAANKRYSLAERLHWAIEQVTEQNPINLNILFDRDELNILEKIFSQANIEQMDERLAIIYQQINQLADNPKPFRITL
ncbi:MAG: hypothetical protein WAQ98_24545 [Blastocatellia bacterium]